MRKISATRGFNGDFCFSENRGFRFPISGEEIYPGLYSQSPSCPISTPNVSRPLNQFELNYVQHAASRSNERFQHKIQQGLNLMEWKALECGFSVHWMAGSPNDCQSKIYTFDPKTGEVENAYIYGFVQPLNPYLEHSDIPRCEQKLESVSESDSGFNVSINQDFLQDKNWVDTKPPVLLILYDEKKKKLYFENVQKYLAKHGIQSSVDLKRNENVTIQISKDKILNKKNFLAVQSQKNQFFKSLPDGDRYCDPVVWRKQRSLNHVIGDKGVCFFEGKAMDAGCYVDRISAGSDYGIDVNVYTFDNEGRLESGCIFVQVKAQLESKYIEDDEFGKSMLFTKVQTSHLKSWLNHIHPVFFVVYDDKTKNAYYLHIQDYFKDKPLSDRYNTIRIPLENKVDEVGIKKMQEIKNNIMKTL